jgi:hypothetical protein
MNFDTDVSEKHPPCDTEGDNMKDSRRVNLKIHNEGVYEYPLKGMLEGKGEGITRQ